MKTLLAVLALGLGSVQAATWEYAVLSGYDDNTFTWQSPEKNVFSKTLDKLIPEMGCGESKDGWYGVYKCAGTMGWELVLKEEKKTSVSLTTYWVFKRLKP